MTRGFRAIFSKLMQPMPLMALLTTGSGAMLVAAAVFEHGFGLAPCIMCLWQRWPHRVVILLGLAGMAAGLVMGRRGSMLFQGLIAAALMTGAGIAFWHTGVEFGILPGPAACSGSVALVGDTASVLDNLLAAPPVQCDKVPWSFLGLSMATWNGLISVVMAGFAIVGMMRRGRPRYS